MSRELGGGRIGILSLKGTGTALFYPHSWNDLHKLGSSQKLFVLFIKTLDSSQTRNDKQVGYESEEYTAVPSSTSLFPLSHFRSLVRSPVPPKLATYNNDFTWGRKIRVSTSLS